MKEKLCVLSFDELYISHDICFDKKLEQVLDPHKTVQVMMIRGLMSNWKQPVYYSYDTPIKSEVLFHVISILYESGYNIVAMTSDMGSTNLNLLKTLNISYENPTFIHPSTGQRIHTFADVPHLLKLIRNNYLDHGFIINEGKNNT